VDRHAYSIIRSTLRVRDREPGEVLGGPKTDGDTISRSAGWSPSHQGDLGNARLLRAAPGRVGDRTDLDPAN